jgi:hypothetical protein
MRVGSTHQLTARVLLSHDASTNSPIGWVIVPQLVHSHLALRCALHCLASSCLALPCDVPCPALARLASRRLSLPCLAHAIFKKLSSDHLYTLSDSQLIFFPGATLPCLLPCPALPHGALPWLLVPCPDLPPRTFPWLVAWRLSLSCLAQDVLKKLSCDHLHSLSGD